MLPLLLAVIVVCIKSSDAVTCLECDHIPNARACDFARECGPHQVCYTDLYVSSSGYLYRNMGCRSRTVCQGTGRRSLTDLFKRNAMDTLTCSDCCDDELCQGKYCGDTDFPSPRGPICFHCDQQEKEYCNNIVLCDEDQVCRIAVGHPADASDSNILTTGCFSKLSCDLYKNTMVGKRGHVGPTINCFECCHTDLCNKQCQATVTTTTTTTTTTTAPPQTSKPTPLFTRAPCTDTASVSTCGLAAVQNIVCGNSTMAKNAGCQHTCGFC